MNDLIKVDVRIENEQMITDSRNIAEVFSKRHDNVVRDIENLRKDVLNFEEMFFETKLADSYGRPQRAYYMNRDGFSLLAMGFTGKEALEWKLKYIEAFNAMEKVWNSPEQVFARALKMADQTIDRLKNQNAGLLEDVKRMKPKEIFADAVACSQTSILIGDLAKILKQNGIEIGQKRLFEKLRNEGFLIKGGSSKNMPTQRAMEMGLFEVKEGSYVDSVGRNITTKTTKVTGRGQQYFINRYLAAVEI